MISIAEARSQAAALVALAAEGTGAKVFLDVAPAGERLGVVLNLEDIADLDGSRDVATGRSHAYSADFTAVVFSFDGRAECDALADKIAAALDGKSSDYFRLVMVTSAAGVPYDPEFGAFADELSLRLVRDDKWKTR